VRPDPASLGPWAGFGLFCLYTAITLGLAAWLLRRRDV
jgi:ABC-2 type transport system permease protein